MHIPNIKSYYEATRIDYRWVWNTRNTMALHFGYYDENASKHDLAVHNMTRIMADKANISAGSRVLDAGCGVGGSCIWLSKNRDAIVTGITPIHSQIAECEKNAKENGAKNVDFVECYYEKTPFADHTFDAVWACESFCYAKDKSLFYKEAYRILKPGGRLIIADYIRITRPLQSEKNEKLLLEWLNPWAIFDIDTSEENQLNAANFGFTHIQIEDITKNVRTSLRNLYHHAVKWLPYGRLLNKINLVSDVRVGNATASVRQYEALDKNLWYYAFISATKPNV